MGNFVKWLKTRNNSRDRPVRGVFLLTILLLLEKAHLIFGGNCWLSMNRNGRCTSLVKIGVSREECCESDALGGYNSVSWNDGEPLTSSAVFLMHLHGGLECTRCKATCDGVRCPNNQSCVVRRGVPKCVCAPNCAKFKLQNRLQNYQGKVCGTDDRTYKSICRLLRRSCQANDTTLEIAYFGECRSSCEKVVCLGNKQCVLDQNMKPHCVDCSSLKCSAPLNGRPKQLICGVDDVTYNSICELRQHACRQGKAIPMAYKGACIQEATCTKIKCFKGQACLQELNSKKPRCVTCNFLTDWCNYLLRTFKDPLGPLCSTNGKTYKHWCDMIEEACWVGKALDAKHFGQCFTNDTALT